MKFYNKKQWERRRKIKIKIRTCLKIDAQADLSLKSKSAVAGVFLVPAAAAPVTPCAPVAGFSEVARAGADEDEAGGGLAWVGFWDCNGVEVTVPGGLFFLMGGSFTFLGGAGGIAEAGAAAGALGSEGGSSFLDSGTGDDGGAGSLTMSIGTTSASTSSSTSFIRG